MERPIEIEESSHSKAFNVVSYVLVLGSIILLPVLWQRQVAENPLAEDFCSSHLAYAKAQLAEAKTLKARTEKLLAEAQQHQETDKNRVNDMVDGCLNMMDQKIVCQDRLDSLKTHCKKARSICVQADDELRMLKNITNIPIIT